MDKLEMTAKEAESWATLQIKQPSGKELNIERPRRGYSVAEKTLIALSARDGHIEDGIPF